MNPFRSLRAQALVTALSDPDRPTPVAMTPTAVVDGTVASIRLYDAIDSWGGWWGISAKEFTAVLDALPADVSEIRVLINSPGGEVTEGIAILNALRSHKAKTVAVVEGLAASSASFIAAGCDETVMMRGSEMFIHNAWMLTWGDAEDLHGYATQLEEHFDRNIAEVYADKSGKTIDHWLGEMAKDQFLNAEQAVEAGLADRTEGGSTEEAAKARAAFDLSIFTTHGAAAAAVVPKPPANAPADPIHSTSAQAGREGDLVGYEDLQAGLRERLGITDADASDVTLLGAFDLALEQARAENTTVTVTATPEGTTLIDHGVLSQLQQDAAAGREAREAQVSDRRNSIVQSAIDDGRISPATRDSWRAQLDKDEDGVSALLASLPKNTIPVAELGHSDDAITEEGRLEALAGWGEPKKEEVA